MLVPLTLTLILVGATTASSSVPSDGFVDQIYKVRTF